MLTSDTAYTAFRKAMAAHSQLHELSGELRRLYSVATGAYRDYGQDDSSDCGTMIAKWYRRGRIIMARGEHWLAVVAEQCDIVETPASCSDRHYVEATRNAMRYSLDAMIMMRAIMMRFDALHVATRGAVRLGSVVSFLQPRARYMVPVRRVSVRYASRLRDYK